MKKRKLLAALAGGVALAGAWTLALQPAYGDATTAAAQLPDVVGFHLGVSAEDGMTQLKAHDPKGQVRTDTVTIPEISSQPLAQELTLSQGDEMSSPEAVQLGVTFPPGKPVVWRIARQLLAMSPDKDMSRAALIDALRKKYGPETYIASPNIGMTTMVWLFDEQGKPVADNKPPESPCAVAPVTSNTNGLGMAVLNQPSPTFPQDKSGGWLKCKSLVYVRAVLQPDNMAGNADAISNFAVSVGDQGLATRSQDATAAFIAKTDSQQQPPPLQGAPNL